MKKFYPFILTMIFLGAGAWAQAQTVYNSIADNSTTNYTLDDGNFWQGGAPPLNPCNNCTINIYTSVTVVPDDGTSSTGAAAGTETSLSDLVINGGTLNIYGETTVTINTYVELFGTKVTIGNDPTTPASIILNGQIDINTGSTIQLANSSTIVDVNNDDGVPVIGPRVVENNPSFHFSGLYYIRSNGGTPGIPNDDTYDYTLNRLVMANASGSYILGQKYTINCDALNPANSCSIGLLFGPASLQYDMSNDFYGFAHSTTLPVSLVQFIASENADGSNKLSWSTAQEVNAGSFEVERSADQGSWDAIGTVKAKGNSSITTNYTYIDQFPLAGNNYYRLKMIDLDGKFKYSNTVLVSSAKDTRPLVVYQNPWVDQIRVKVNVNKTQTLTLTVSDMIGKTYLKQSYNAQAGDNYINLAPAGAASGMYILHIQGTTYEQTVKLAKN